MASIEEIVPEIESNRQTDRLGQIRDLHNQLVTEYLVSRGADIEAQDTYGYRPLHRMASNNLGVGAEALRITRPFASGVSPGRRQ